LYLVETNCEEKAVEWATEKMLPVFLSKFSAYRVFNMNDKSNISNPLTLRETQIDTIQILKKFDAICESLNITYWGMYGTLIGAIRHNGFIPWDDDLDLSMPRTDYEKLLHHFSCHHNLIDGLYLDNLINDSTSFFYISRICDREHQLVFDNYNHESGLFLDIYPLDGMGNDNDKEFWIRNKTKRIYNLKKHLELVNRKGILCGNGILHKVVNVPIVMSSRMHGAKYYFDQLDSISKTYTWEESTYVGLPGWANWLRFLKKEWFQNTIRVPFEDTMIPVPSEYDKVLTEIYGDYMKLPPTDNRKPQHDYKVYRIT